jgi:predicted phosphodiesterase
MKAHLFSDIHWEHMGRHSGESFFDQLADLNAREPVDLCILAGDICQVARHQYLFIANLVILAKYYKQIIMVPGNHEYYGGSFWDVDQFYQLLETHADLANVEVLQNEFFTYNGQRFYGGTMWFPHQEYGYLKTYLSDFSTISGFEPEVYMRHQQFVDNLRSLRPDDVVISHHGCTPDSIHPDYAGSPINDFFVYDVQPLLKPENIPKYWLHGHTHMPMQYTATNGMKVFCNPLGYPNEGTNPDFWNRAVIEF